MAIIKTNRKQKIIVGNGDAVQADIVKGDVVLDLNGNIVTKNDAGELTVVAEKNQENSYTGTSPIRVITQPKSGYFSRDMLNNQGFLRITLPAAGTNTMLTFDLTLFQYTASRSFKAFVAFYNYSGGAAGVPTAHNLTTRKLTAVNSAINGVRVYRELKAGASVGSTDMNDYSMHLMLGADIATGSAWRYPKVVLNNLILGYANTESVDWDSGWSIGFEPSIPANYTLINNNLW